MNKLQTSALAAVIAGCFGFALAKLTTPAPPSSQSTTVLADQVPSKSPSVVWGRSDTEKAAKPMVAPAAKAYEPLTIAEFKQEMEAIQSTGWMGLKGIRRTSALMERLVQSDLASLAREMTAQSPGSDYQMGLHIVMNAYADQDPEGAWNLALTLSPGQARQSALNAAAAGITSRDPKRAFALADSLSDPQIKNQVRTMAASQLAAKDPREALKLYLSTKTEDSGNLHDGTLSMIFQQWARSDMEGAKVAAAELTGQQKSQAMSAVLNSFAQSDPKAAWEYAKTLPPATQTHEDPRLRVIQAWSSTDPAAALAAAQTIQETGVRDAATSNALMMWSRSDFDAALNYALSVESPTLRSDIFRSMSANSEGNREKLLTAVLDYMPPGSSFQQSIQQIFSSWANSDPKQASEAVFRLPPGPILSQAASQVASNLAKTGTKTEVLAWVRKLPEGATRSDSINAVFREWAANDPTTARNALASVDPADRSRATTALAAGWSQKDPEAVIRWSKTVDSEKDRNQIVREAMMQWAGSDLEAAARQISQLAEADRSVAMQAVVSRWAAKDSASAGDWLDRQPANNTRDSAVSTLARTLSVEDPEAALEWASKITDEKNRNRQLENFSRTWLANEPATARKWISSSDLLSPETKEKLLK